MDTISNIKIDTTDGYTLHSVEDDIKEKIFSMHGSDKLLCCDLTKVNRDTIEKLSNLNAEHLTHNNGEYALFYTPISHQENKFSSFAKYTVYGAKDVARYMIYRIGDYYSIYDNENVVILIPDKEDIIKLLKECLCELGYSENARKYCNDYQFGDFVFISFSPVWKNPLNELTIKQFKDLWFVTPYENIKHIKKYGFIPRTTLGDNIGEYILDDDFNVSLLNMQFKDFFKHRYYLCIKIKLNDVEPRNIYVEPTPYGNKVCVNYRIEKTAFANEYIVFDCDKWKSTKKYWNKLQHIKDKIGPVWPLWK